jgi:glutamine amidotransferase
MQKVGIVDYGMGNLKSVANALAYLGCEPVLVTDAQEVSRLDRIILPGVGAYLKAMQNLVVSGFDQAIRSHVQRGRPLLGICLGMQLFSTFGTEPERCQGLGLIAGEVTPFRFDPARRVPHIGWNGMKPTRNHPLLVGLKENADFYFVHSYCFIPADAGDVLGLTEYGESFVSAVARGCIAGFQFHPEKSQENGMKLLENFAGWDGAC